MFKEKEGDLGSDGTLYSIKFGNDMTSSRTVSFSKEIFMKFFIYSFIFSSYSSTVIRLIVFHLLHVFTFDLTSR
jgi:hypothetical protein